MRELVRGYLASRGVTAITAHLGEDLFQVFQQEGIRAVLLGTVQPGEKVFSSARDFGICPAIPGYPSQVFSAMDTDGCPQGSAKRGSGYHDQALRRGRTCRKAVQASRRRLTQCQNNVLFLPSLL